MLSHGALLILSPEPSASLMWLIRVRLTPRTEASTRDSAEVFRPKHHARVVTKGRRKVRTVPPAPRKAQDSPFAQFISRLQLPAGRVGTRPCSDGRGTSR